MFRKQSSAEQRCISWCLWDLHRHNTHPQIKHIGVGCAISGFQGARPPESAAAVASAPGSTSNARRLQQAGPPPLRGLLDALTAAPTDDPDIPELVADEYYEEYEPFGGNEDGGPLQGVAPVADVRHNSSLVLEECLVEGNNVRHADGAVISISAAASDYDDSDFPCSVAVRGGVVQSSFSTRADSNRVLPCFRLAASLSTLLQELLGRGGSRFVYWL